MSDEFRAKRWGDFRRGVDFSPEMVYRHRTHGWEYIPVRPFGDEPEVLARLGMRPDDCRSVDAWWGIDGDATLLESCIIGICPGPARLSARATDHVERWVYLVAVFDTPFVTRTAFEATMVLFADAGFPHAPQFRLRWGDAPAQLKGEIG